MNWDECCKAWADAYWGSRHDEADEIIERAREWLKQFAREDYSAWLVEVMPWFIEAMTFFPDQLFVAKLLKTFKLPEELFMPFLLAGVMERNPSMNRVYIEPCVISRGAPAVFELLLGYFENGTNAEKAGAASASYWVRGEISPELEDRKRTTFLREFVTNEDTNVRCRIVPFLELNPDLYREDIRPLIDQALTIARAHPSEYIRHRIEIQLGSGGPYMAIPTQILPTEEAASRFSLGKMKYYGMAIIILNTFLAFWNTDSLSLSVFWVFGGLGLVLYAKGVGRGFFWGPFLGICMPIFGPIICLLFCAKNVKKDSETGKS